MISVEISEDLFADAVGLIEDLTREIESEFVVRLGIEADVRFISPRSQLHENPASDDGSKEGHPE